MSPRKKQPPKCAVELTRRSLADLLDIERYSIEPWGRKTAGKYLAEIAAALDRLREQPEILRLEPDFASGLYFYRVKKHFLICDYRGGTVLVLTAFHSSLDVPARLVEVEPRLLAESQFLQGKLHRKTDR